MRLSWSRKNNSCKINCRTFKKLFYYTLCKIINTIKDIIVQPAFHFHKLDNKNGKNYAGYFAIDVKSRREQWRIIMEPLNENKLPYTPCNIDEISELVRIVEIAEVSKHYE